MPWALLGIKSLNSALPLGIHSDPALSLGLFILAPTGQIKLKTSTLICHAREGAEDFSSS